MVLREVRTLLRTLDEAAEYHKILPIPLSSLFAFMKIEQKTVSYTISFARGKDRQKTSVVEVSQEKELKDLVLSTFKGRFRKPSALSYKDAVNVTVNRLDHIKHQMSQVLNVKVFNKSVRQARIEVEQAIRQPQNAFC